MTDKLEKMTCELLSGSPYSRGWFVESFRINPSEFEGKTFPLVIGLDSFTEQPRCIGSVTLSATETAISGTLRFDDPVQEELYFAEMTRAAAAYTVGGYTLAEEGHFVASSIEIVSVGIIAVPTEVKP